MPLLKSTQDAVNRVTPIEAHIKGSDMTFTGGSYSPVHNGSSVLFCKAASLRSDGTAGFLAVHLTGDSTSSWYLADMIPGQSPMGLEFDKVGDSTNGSTVAFDSKLCIYPALYNYTSNTY